MSDTKSLQGWDRHLRRLADAEELTREDALLLCLFNIQNHLWSVKTDVAESRQAAEHTEGMIGRLDQFAATLAVHAHLAYPRGVRTVEELEAARAADRPVQALEGAPDAEDL